MILFIDTSEFENIQFSAISTKAQFTEILTYKKALNFNENWRTNEYLAGFMKSNKLKLSDISKIFVCSGPGSFTGIRVGLSMAQGIGFALGVDVVAASKDRIPYEDLSRLVSVKGSKKLVVSYGSEPHITMAPTKKVAKNGV